VSPWKGWAWAALLIWLGVVLDQGAAASFQIGPGRPAFALTFALTIALFIRPSGGAILGFAVGFAAGALSGVGMTAQIISTAIAAYLAAFAAKQPAELAPMPAAAIVAAAVLLARLGTIFVQPAGGIGPYLASASISALLCAVISLAVYPIARRIFQPKEA
jgi:hypothetical protein